MGRLLVYVYELRLRKLWVVDEEQGVRIEK